MHFRDFLKKVLYALRKSRLCTKEKGNAFSSVILNVDKFVIPAEFGVIKRKDSNSP